MKTAVKLVAPLDQAVTPIDPSLLQAILPTSPASYRAETWEQLIHLIRFEIEVSPRLLDDGVVRGIRSLKKAAENSESQEVFDQLRQDLEDYMLLRLGLSFAYYPDPDLFQALITRHYESPLRSLGLPPRKNYDNLEFDDIARMLALAQACARSVDVEELFFLPTDALPARPIRERYMRNRDFWGPDAQERVLLSEGRLSFFFEN